MRITPGTWLSCVPPRISHDPYGGITADQIAARHIGQDTPLPSLELGTEERGGEGSCDRDYGCSYGKTIAFRDPSTPLPMEHNPRKLFQQLFGQGDTDEEREALVDGEPAACSTWSARCRRPRSAASARATARCSMTTSTRCARSSGACRSSTARDMSKVNLPDAPAGIPSRFDEHIAADVRHDRAGLPGEPDACRQLHDGRRGQQPPYNFIGISDAFHPLSHHANNPQKMERLAQLQTWNTGEFAKFVKKLAGTAGRRRLDARPLASSCSAAT